MKSRKKLHFYLNLLENKTETINEFLFIEEKKKYQNKLKNRNKLCLDKIQVKVKNLLFKDTTV